MIIQKNFENILFNIENSIGRITLNRPKRLNALNFPLMMGISHLKRKESRNLRGNE